MPVTVHINTAASDGVRGQSLFDCAELVGVHVPTSCRKQGKCRECLVEVVEGQELLTLRAPEEESLQGRFRLACRARINADTGSIRCHTLRRGAMQIEQEAYVPPQAGRTPSLDPAVTREGDWVLLDSQPLVKASGPLHGLAMDLGTTTVALRLVNLESGAVVARTAFENPQRFGGSDVMARIHFDGAHPGRLLQRAVLAYLAHAIAEMPVDPQTIYEVTVAGNSTMRDLFFGLDVHSIGQKPFRSLTEHEWRAGSRPGTSLAATARALRLPVCPEARVYGLPLIGCHVGADAAANLLAIDLMHEERLVAVMDIGTNTELVVGNRHRALAASGPAGPAFEGGGVVCGMPALPGAIERVAIGADGRVQAGVIGNQAAEGICGSGLVDLLGELLRTGRMNSRGRYGNGLRSFTVDAPGQVVLGERDISELAQAKGANVAGLQILFKQHGKHFRDAEVFYLAGGFARHLDVDASRRIGLIPNLDPARVVQAGNLAIEGATIALLSRTRRAELEQFVTTITHVELETDPDFFDHFALGCQFAPVDEVEAGERQPAFASARPA